MPHGSHYSRHLYQKMLIWRRHPFWPPMLSKVISCHQSLITLSTILLSLAWIRVSPISVKINRFPSRLTTAYLLCAHFNERLSTDPSPPFTTKLPFSSCRDDGKVKFLLSLFFSFCFCSPLSCLAFAFEPRFRPLNSSYSMR
jgi:hypothetical protein